MGSNRMLRTRLFRSFRQVRPLGSDESFNGEFVEVTDGINKGYKVRTNFKSRNPRNLEMLNIAHRDMGWAAGPPNQETRFVPFHKQVGHSEDGMRLAVTNLPAQNSYHTVEIMRKESSIECVCRQVSFSQKRTAPPPILSDT